MVVRDEPVPPRQLLPRLPRDIETICLKCLQKDPNHRYATAGDLADDLARFINDEPVYARPIRPWERWIRWARRHPSTAALIVIGVLAVTGGAGFLAYSQYQRKRVQAQLRDQTNEHLHRGKEAIAREDWKAA
jgi:serine/threonine protein kinase